MVREDFTNTEKAPTSIHGFWQEIDSFYCSFILLGRGQHNILSGFINYMLYEAVAPFLILVPYFE